MTTITLGDILEIIRVMRSQNNRSPGKDMKFLLEFARKAKILNQPIYPDAQERLNLEIERLQDEIETEIKKIVELVKKYPSLKLELQAIAGRCEWIGLDRFIVQLATIFSMLGIECSTAKVAKMSYIQRLDYAIELLDKLADHLSKRMDELSGSSSGHKALKKDLFDVF